jgi:hypothetical protein
VTVKNAVFWDVGHVRTCVLEEEAVSIFKADRICELGIMLAVTSRENHSVKKH